MYNLQYEVYRTRQLNTLLSRAAALVQAATHCRLPVYSGPHVFFSRAKLKTKNFNLNLLLYLKCTVDTPFYGSAQLSI